MNASQQTSGFTRTIYRDFALFALAAISVGFAVSLILATAIVLVAPEPSHAAPDRAAAGPRTQKTQVAQENHADGSPTSARQLFIRQLAAS
jgi:hypothetical protein